MPEDRVEPKRRFDDADLAVARKMLALHKRTGAIYAGDPATGRIERISTGRMEQRVRDARTPIVHVPERRENVTTRPREHRSRSRTRSTTRGDPDDDPEPGRAGLPQFRVIPPAEFRRQLDAALGGKA